ncbi:MAG: radical SAM protein [Phycisphaeraceae bacterium]
MNLLVHDIQRFCLHDGPGIRTTLFLQGCPLRCWWCHNPDMQGRQGGQARRWAILPLLRELERDARFWRRSGGGVTVSGGEPLVQSQAVAGLLREMGKRGHHRTLETAGCVPADHVRRVAPHIDLWLWDIKSVDGERFRKATHGTVDRVLDNLAWVLGQTQTPLRVRVPLIDGFNADTVHLTRIADWLASQPRRVEVELLPGHDTGRRPSDVAHRSARVTAGQIDAARDLLLTHGLLHKGAPV